MKTLSLVWFKPKAKFFNILKELIAKHSLDFVFEIGGGAFNNFKGYTRHGIKHLGCDPYFDPFENLDLINRVMCLEFSQCSMLKRTPTLTVVCRPDHGMWTRDIRDYIHEDSVLIYVGFEKNLANDLGENANYEVLATNVGKDHEAMYKVNNK